MSKNRSYFWEKKSKALRAVLQDITTDTRKLVSNKGGGWKCLVLFDDYPPQVQILLYKEGSTIPGKYFDELGYTLAHYTDDHKSEAADILGAICSKYGLTGGLSKKAASAVSGTLTYVLWKE